VLFWWVLFYKERLCSQKGKEDKKPVSSGKDSAQKHSKDCVDYDGSPCKSVLCLVVSNSQRVV
jgi:hypothetical protein